MLKRIQLGYTTGHDFNLRRKGGGEKQKAGSQLKSSDIHI
jgi:hypothetical protein